MAKRSSPSREVYVDNSAPAPNNVRNVKRKEAPPGGDEKQTLTNSAPEVGGTLVPNFIGVIDPNQDYSAPGGVLQPGTLAAPTWLNVIKQVERTNSKGDLVIDVIVEVEDVPGATNYEFRKTAIE
jgi:hypothetical protein